MSTDENENNRSTWLWVAGIYFIAVGLFSIVRTLLPVVGATEPESELTTGDYVFVSVFWLIWSLYILGGLSLIRRRRYGFTVFALAILATITANLVYTLINGSPPLGTDELALIAPEWIILIATTAYAWKLNRAGYLR